jgi:hypothetical protein
MAAPSSPPRRGGAERRGGSIPFQESESNSEVHPMRRIILPYNNTFAK